MVETVIKGVSIEGVVTVVPSDAWFCKDCKTSFSSKRRPERQEQIIFEEYFLHRQTLKQLSGKVQKLE
jgi:hypothetical protein